MLFLLFATVLRPQVWMCADQQAHLFMSLQSDMVLEFWKAKVMEMGRAITTLLVHLHADI